MPKPDAFADPVVVLPVYGADVGRVGHRSAASPPCEILAEIRQEIKQ